MDGLKGAGHEVQGIDVVPGDDVVVADLASDVDALSGLLDGSGAVVHLAAIAAETDFATAVESHIGMTQRVLEAAVACGVPRVVYASSNHAVGFTPRAPLVRVDTPVRPDSFYGFGKAACEALCSLYHDRYGLSVACLRIGSFRDRPTTRRHLSTWLSPGDAVRLVDACLSAPDLGFSILYGISGNTRAWWDLGPARALGYEPGTMPRHGRQRSNARLRRVTTSSTSGCSEATSPARTDGPHPSFRHSVVQTVDLVIVSS